MVRQLENAGRFMILAQDAGRFMIGKYLIDQKILWKRKRRSGIVVAGNMPTASFLTKMGKMQLAAEGVGCAK